MSQYLIFPIQPMVLIFFRHEDSPNPMWRVKLIKRVRIWRCKVSPMQHAHTFKQIKKTRCLKAMFDVVGQQDIVYILLS